MRAAELEWTTDPPTLTGAWYYAYQRYTDGRVEMHTVCLSQTNGEVPRINFGNGKIGDGNDYLAWLSAGKTFWHKIWWGDPLISELTDLDEIEKVWG